MSFFHAGVILNPNACAQSAIDKFLSAKDGQCGSWAALLLHGILSQGLAGPTGKDSVAGLGTLHYLQVTPIDDKEGFLVGPWQFGKKNGAAEYPWVNKSPGFMKVVQKALMRTDYYPQVAGKYKYKFSLAPVNYSPGKLLVAQNTTNPFGLFRDHALVRIGSLYLDPSYGQSFLTLFGFQQYGLAGFYVMNEMKGVDGQFWMRIRRTPLFRLDLDERDISFVPEGA